MRQVAPGSTIVLRNPVVAGGEAFGGRVFILRRSGWVVRV